MYTWEVGPIRYVISEFYFSDHFHQHPEFMAAALGAFPFPWKISKNAIFCETTKISFLFLACNFVGVMSSHFPFFM